MAAVYLTVSVFPTVGKTCKALFKLFKSYIPFVYLFILYHVFTVGGKMNAPFDKTISTIIVHFLGLV